MQYMDKERRNKLLWMIALCIRIMYCCWEAAPPVTSQQQRYTPLHRVRLWEDPLQQHKSAPVSQ